MMNYPLTNQKGFVKTISERPPPVNLGGKYEAIPMGKKPSRPGPAPWGADQGFTFKIKLAPSRNDSHSLTLLNPTKATLQLLD